MEGTVELWIGGKTKGWKVEAYGSSHEGRPVALLADGTEPTKPVYLDCGSGGSVPSTTEWWAYNGILGKQCATALRASCSRGWRGAERYPIDWTHVSDRRDIDLSGPYEDWGGHIDDVDSRSIPLPLHMEDLLAQLEERLSGLVDDMPVAALKTAVALEQIARRIGYKAAWRLGDEPSWDEIGEALGLPARDAKSQVFQFVRAS
jgi:hypothetical protein